MLLHRNEPLWRSCLGGRPMDLRGSACDVQIRGKQHEKETSITLLLELVLMVASSGRVFDCYQLIANTVILHVSKWALVRAKHCN